MADPTNQDPEDIEEMPLLDIGEPLVEFDEDGGAHVHPEFPEERA